MLVVPDTGPHLHLPTAFASLSLSLSMDTCTGTVPVVLWGGCCALSRGVACAQDSKPCRQASSGPAGAPVIPVDGSSGEELIDMLGYRVQAVVVGLLIVVGSGLL